MQRRLCGLRLSSVGIVAVLFYFIEKSIAALDGYVPEEDYPAYTEVPSGLSFTCDDKIPGYYADPETMCQVWHWCVPGIGGNTMYSFLCAPGTVFNQKSRVCDWFFKVDCPNAPAYYGVNEDLYKDEQGNFIAGKKSYKEDKRFCVLHATTLSEDNVLRHHSSHDEYNRRRLEARRKRQQQARKPKSWTVW